MNRTDNSVMEIDILKLLNAFLRRWWLIVLCTVVCATAAFLYTEYFITPIYRADVTVYVNNSKAGTAIDYVSGSNISASQKLVNTYVNIIKSDTVLEKVIESANLDISIGELRGLMSTSQVGDTELFKVYICHPSPERAAYIANAVADIAPGEIENFIEGSSTKIIDYAKVPASRFTPSYSKNTVIGAVIGLFIAIGYLTIAFLMDVRIKDEQDLASISDLPILGQIPSFDQLGNQNGYGKKHNKYDTYTAKETGGN